MDDDLRNIVHEVGLLQVEKPERTRFREWSLVLTAMGIDHVMDPEQGIFVARSEASSAVEEIRRYEHEESVLQKMYPDTEAKQGRVYIHLFILSLLLLFFTAVNSNLGMPAREWMELGRADADKIIRQNELWRTVTSLTLHSDPAHVLGNVIIGAPFIISTCALLGTGLGWLCVILGGALGNYINAWVVAPPHLSIGFSTSVFAAVGIMSINSIRHSRLKAGNAFVLGLALLALLGVGGKNTDLGAHLFGLSAGFFLGWLVMIINDNMESVSRLNFLFGLAAVLIVLESWTMAIENHGLLDMLIIRFGS